MVYYNTLPTDLANKLYTITTTFGKYEEICLAMGVCIAPDIFQERMSALMDDLEFVRFYLNNLLINTSASFKGALIQGWGGYEVTTIGLAQMKDW